MSEPEELTLKSTPLTVFVYLTDSNRKVRDDCYSSEIESEQELEDEEEGEEGDEEPHADDCPPTPLE